MNALPVVAREMRALARRPGAYWSRSVVAGLGIGAWLTLLSAGPARPSELGLVLLIVLGLIFLLIGLFGGALITADCLSSEKREGTLGLLFLTDLKPWDVVLGKMTASAAGVATALVAGLPVLSLSWLTGGVTIGETWRIMLAILIALFAGLSIGALVSTLSIQSTRAFSLSLVAAGALLILPLFALAIVESYGAAAPENPLYCLSPVYPLIMGIDRNYVRLGGFAYWQSISLVTLVGSVSLLLSTVWLPSRWQDRPKSAAKAKSDSDETASAGSRPARRPALLDRNPYQWRRSQDARADRGARWFIRIACVVWVAAMWIAVTTRREEEAFLTACAAAFLVHLTVKFLTALETIRPVCEELKSGEMELLLAAPVDADQIVLGHLSAIRARFDPMARCAGILNAAMLCSVFVFYDHLHMAHGAGLVFSVFFIGGWVALGVDLRAIRWTGLAQALAHSTEKKAVFRTLRPVLLTPWIIAPLLLAVAAGINADEEMIGALFTAWFVVGVLVNGAKTHRAKIILKRFRELAVTAGGG